MLYLPDWMWIMLQPKQVQAPPKQEMAAQPEPEPVTQSDPTPAEVQDDFQEVVVEDQ